MTDDFVSARNPTAADVREWASIHGLAVSEKGRIPRVVRQAHDEAHRD